MDKLRLFTLPTCPQCKMFHMLMDQKKIQYEECQDMATMQALGIKHTPVLEVKTETIDEQNNNVETVKLLSGKEIMNYINGARS